MDVVSDKIAKVFVVPKVEGTLGNLAVVRKVWAVSACRTNLKVGTGDGSSELAKQRLLHLDKLCGIHDFEYVLDLVQEHNFLGTVDLWPIT